MVPILSILCPKQPLRDVEPAFLFPVFLVAGWSLRRRAHIPLARVSTRKSRSNLIRERTASILLSLSSDSRISASSSPSKLRRDCEMNKIDEQCIPPINVFFLFFFKPPLTQTTIIFTACSGRGYIFLHHLR